MADFIKVIKTRNRMCAMYCLKTISNCSPSCPLRGYHDGSGGDCDSFILANPLLALPEIEKWAKENPETRMPTWREWLEDPRSMTEEALNMPIPEHLLSILNIDPIIVEEE